MNKNIVSAAALAESLALSSERRGKHSGGHVPADWSKGRRRRFSTEIHSGRLVGADVIDRCTKCQGPIFAQSVNVDALRSLHVDGSQKHRHVRCPKRANA